MEGTTCPQLEREDEEDGIGSDRRSTQTTAVHRSKVHDLGGTELHAAPIPWAPSLDHWTRAFWTKQQGSCKGRTVCEEPPLSNEDGDHVRTSSQRVTM
eukprot:5622026-Pyramimonas_sp.AAC.1